MKRRAFLRTGLAGVGVAGLSATPLAGAATARGLGALFDPRASTDGPVRLSSNENPLGLSPAAREAVLDGLDEANRYPGATGGALREALAARLDIPPERLFFGAGSTEILRVSVQAWAAPGARLIYAEPTFEDVPGYAAPFPFHLVPVPLTRDFEHDIGRMREAAEESPYPGIVYICNPNNPTGGITPTGPLDAWIAEADEQTLFLVDEAYYEYADDPAYRSAASWAAEKRNVIVVRTFSKIYAMAGMRLGYGIAHPRTAARVRPFTTRNNPNHLAGVAAIASLEDSELVGRSLEANAAAKAIVHACLDDLGVAYLPSHTNFIMHRIRGDLGTYNERMAEAGFRVGRPFPPMTEYSRLSMGLPADMERFAETLRDFRRRGWI